MKIKKIIFKAREEASLETEELPDAPLGNDEIAGATLVSAVSPGTELAVYRGLMKGGRFPCASGYAAVFEVEHTGSNVKQFRPGDRVFCMGNHKSFQRVRENDAVLVPHALPAERAVFARLMSITMSTLVTTTARPPERVLVTGLGIVGYLAAQIFQSCGYNVLACDPSEDRCKLALKNNIKNVLRAIPMDNPSVAGKIALCVECSGHEQAVLDACKTIQKRGEMVLVGVPWARRTDLSAHDILSAVFHRYIVLRSGWEWEVPIHPTDFRAGSIMGNLAGAIEWIEEDKIRLDGIYTNHHPGEAQTVYQNLMRTHNCLLTAVFDWTS